MAVFSSAQLFYSTRKSLQHGLTFWGLHRSYSWNQPQGIKLFRLWIMQVMNSLLCGALLCFFCAPKLGLTTSPLTAVTYVPHVWVKASQQLVLNYEHEALPQVATGMSLVHNWVAGQRSENVPLSLSRKPVPATLTQGLLYLFEKMPFLGSFGGRTTEMSPTFVQRKLLRWLEANRSCVARPDFSRGFLGLCKGCVLTCPVECSSQETRFCQWRDLERSWSKSENKDPRETKLLKAWEKWVKTDFYYLFGDGFHPNAYILAFGVWALTHTHIAFVWLQTCLSWLEDQQVLLLGVPRLCSRVQEGFKLSDLNHSWHWRITTLANLLLRSFSNLVGLGLNWKWVKMKVWCQELQKW